MHNFTSPGLAWQFRREGKVEGGESQRIAKQQRIPQRTNYKPWLQEQTNKTNKTNKQTNKKNKKKNQTNKNKKNSKIDSGARTRLCVCAHLETRLKKEQQQQK